jgi:hypothetical protein
MQSSPSTLSSFRQSYIERDQIEENRFEDDRRRRHGMVVALVPLGIAMALIVHYTNIVVTIDDADWQYVLHRPNFAHIMKLSLAPIIGGGLAMLFAGLVATTAAGREGRYLPLIMTAVLYTLFLPAIVGLLLPANLFLLDITGLSFAEYSVGEALSSWILSTPFFVLIYTMTGFKAAFWAAIGAVLLAAAVFRFMGPNNSNFSVTRTSVVTTIVGLSALLVIMFGPLEIFEVLYNEFRLN